MPMSAAAATVMLCRNYKFFLIFSRTFSKNSHNFFLFTLDGGKFQLILLYFVSFNFLFIPRPGYICDQS